MTRYTFQRFLPIFVLLLLFMTACTTPGGNTGNGTTPTPAQKSTASSTTGGASGTPTPTQSDICPIPGLASSGATCLTPHQLRLAYAAESLIEHGYTGAGQTIIDVVSFGSPTLQQDMDAFDQKFGLPPIKIQVISPLNEPVYDPHKDRSGWAQETELDVEIIHAIAPGASIIVMTSPVAETEGTVGLPEFLQLEQYALTHHLGSIVSQSWGASEVTLKDSAGQQEIQKWNSFYQQATTKDGMSFFSSSGDNGATDYINQQATILSPTATTSFPADNPWVTSVGGTTVSINGNTVQESAWSDSGGGFSSFFPEPSYQKLLPSNDQSELNNKRGVPDVAASMRIPARALPSTSRDNGALSVAPATLRRSGQASMLSPTRWRVTRWAFSTPRSTSWERPVSIPRTSATLPLATIANTPTASMCQAIMPYPAGTPSPALAPPSPKS